jgi:hypothetical protein
VVCAPGAWRAGVNCASRVPAHRGSQLELYHRARHPRSKNPRGGREDEDKGESEGITGEKDEEGGTLGRRHLAPPRGRLEPPRRRLCCVVACSGRGDREPAPIRMVGGPVRFRAAETGKREASFGSGPVFVPVRPETNTHSSSHPDWKRAAAMHLEWAQERANPVETNEP